MKRKIIYLPIIIGILALNSCKVSPAIKVPYVTYYKGDNTLLYFIKPMNLYYEKNRMSIDFTFADKKIADSAAVTANYTFYKYAKSKGDVYYLQIDGNKYKLKDTETIYEEIKDGKRVARFSSKIYQKELIDLLQKANFQFIVENGTSQKHYIISNKYAKKLKKTSTDIYEIVKDKFE